MKMVPEKLVLEKLLEIRRTAFRNKKTEANSCDDVRFEYKGQLVLVCKATSRPDNTNSKRPIFGLSGSQDALTRNAWIRNDQC